MFLWGTWLIMKKINWEIRRLCIEQTGILILKDRLVKLGETDVHKELFSSESNKLFIIQNTLALSLTGKTKI